MSKMLKNLEGDLTDGYHTFDELYEHRSLLFINLCLLQKEKCSWVQDYEEWFCLVFNSESGQISYHCPNYLKPLIFGKIKNEKHIFDGHKSDDVIFRLRNEAIKS